MSKILLLIILLTSCTSYKLSRKQIIKVGYEVDGWDILKKEQCVANIREMEWELYEGKLIREITMTICDPHTRDKDVINLIKFVHTKYPNYKIEVNRDNEFTRWLLNHTTEKNENNIKPKQR